MGCKKAVRQHLKRLGFVPHNAYYEIGAGRSERINNHIEMNVLFDRLIDMTDRLLTLLCLVSVFQE